jgi:hypothetical protein
MRAMTTVQNPGAIRIGSAKVEVGPDDQNLVDLGTMENVVFEESWTEIRRIGGNVGEISRSIVPSSHVAVVSGDLVEIELENLSIIRGGIDNYTEETGVQVTGAKQTLNAGEWEYDKLIKIEHQNGDGSEITVSEVKGSVSGELTVETDYIITRNDKGEWGILIFEPGEDPEEDQTITITYNYTPLASKTLTSGGAVEISPNVVRLTNYDAQNRKFEITVYKAYNSQGIRINLPNYSDENTAVSPIRLEGVRDESRTLKDQLFKIVDEQGVL